MVKQHQNNGWTWLDQETKEVDTKFICFENDKLNEKKKKEINTHKHKMKMLNLRIICIIFNKATSVKHKKKDEKKEEKET